MKKLFVAIGMVFGIAGYSHAGVVLDPKASYGTSIYGSTATVNGGAVVATVAPGSSGGFACRNCFTKFFVQMSTSAILNVLDGATTSFVIYGSGLGTAGTGSVALAEDHLGPICFTTGNTTTFNLTINGAANVNPNAVNYEGYSWCGVSRNANN